MRRSGTQLGCFGLLVIWSLFAVYAQFISDPGNPDDDAGGRVVTIGIFGALLYILIFGSIASFRSSTLLRQRERRGFPVIQPGDDDV